jgi:hypothetical protein
MDILLSISGSMVRLPNPDFFRSRSNEHLRSNLYHIFSLKQSPIQHGHFFNLLPAHSIRLSTLLFRLELEPLGDGSKPCPDSAHKLQKEAPWKTGPD